MFNDASFDLSRVSRKAFEPNRLCRTCTLLAFGRLSEQTGKFRFQSATRQPLMLLIPSKQAGRARKEDEQDGSKGENLTV